MRNSSCVKKYTMTPRCLQEMVFIPMLLVALAAAIHLHSTIIAVGMAVITSIQLAFHVFLARNPSVTCRPGGSTPVCNRIALMFGAVYTLVYANAFFARTGDVDLSLWGAAIGTYSTVSHIWPIPLGNMLQERALARSVAVAVVLLALYAVARRASSLTDQIRTHSQRVCAWITRVIYIHPPAAPVSVRRRAEMARALCVRRYRKR